MHEIKMTDLLDEAPKNLTIMDALGKCLSQVRSHEKIMVSISGGADSDAMLDLIIRCGGKGKTTFVFHNTGLEYEATKTQLRHLEEKYGIEHSDCYTVWGMKRTGCAGCPFGKDFEEELALAEKYEPKFHKAMLKVFGGSYDYTRRFLEFREQLKNKNED